MLAAWYGSRVSLSDGGNSWPHSAAQRPRGRSRGARSRRRCRSLRRTGRQTARWKRASIARMTPNRRVTMASYIKRRKFLATLGGAAAWPLAARGQQHKMLRVGFVGMQPRETPHYTNFLRRMAELGYQEGRNFTFDYMQTPNVEGYEKNYRELAARKVDVFLAVGSEPALRAALSVANGKPIAFLAIDFDPLAKGYVANLSHPGGNVTGIFVQETELAAKRVEA